MLKKHSFSRYGNSVLPVFVSLILLWNLNELRSNSQSSIVFPPEEMQGASYVPVDDSERISRLPEEDRAIYTKKAYYLPADLSDWEQFSDLYDRKIESIRIFIIGDQEHFTDITIKDPKDCKKFSLALQPRYILRNPDSDFGRSFGGYGGGAALGAMEVRIKGVKKPLIIGIAKIGFYLDVWYGSKRQVFYSKALSVAVDHALKKYSKYRIPEEYLAKQSGIDFLTLPDELKDQ